MEIKGLIHRLTIVHQMTTVLLDNQLSGIKNETSPFILGPYNRDEFHKIKALIDIIDQGSIEAVLESFFNTNARNNEPISAHFTYIVLLSGLLKSMIFNLQAIKKLGMISVLRFREYMKLRRA